MQIVSYSFLDSVAVLTLSKISMSAGSPGSEYSASFNGYPSSGNRSWNNGIANMEQGGCGMRLHAERNSVDLGITTDPQSLQDVALHWPNSMAMCRKSAGEWNPSPQVEPSGERTLPLHPSAGKKQMSDSYIPYNFDVPFQRNSGITSNMSNVPLFRMVTYGIDGVPTPPHFFGPPIAFQSESNHNIHIQQRNYHHVAVPTTKPAQDMGRNISIAPDFVDYPVDGGQIQCSVSFCAKSDGGDGGVSQPPCQPTFPVLRSTGSGSLTKCCREYHQTSPCSAAIESANHSIALGGLWQEKSDVSSGFVSLPTFTYEFAYSPLSRWLYPTTCP